MSRSELDRGMTKYGAASGRKLLQGSTPDKKQKQKQGNRFYTRVIDAARRGFTYFSNYKPNGREFTLNLDMTDIDSLIRRPVDRLKFLGLSRCQLRLLPDIVSGLVHLESLHLEHNHLTALPAWIGKLTKLKHLDISGNFLQYLPDSIGMCSSLEELDANLNRLECLPYTFGNLERLQKVDFHINKLKTLPPSCSNLRSLKYMDLRFNSLRELPVSMGDLQPLDFQGCEMEGQPEFLDLTCSTNFDADSRPQAFSSKITVYSYMEDSKKAKEISKCYDCQLIKTSIILLLDGNPVIVPPMRSLYVTGTATLERKGSEGQIGVACPTS